MASSDITDPIWQGVVRGMADALPSHESDDEGSDLASSYEVIALLVHSYLASLRFRLCGFSEDRLIPGCEQLAPRLPSEWNAGFGSYSFIYKHTQSSMQFLFRVDRMGSKVEVRGLAIGHETIYRFERSVRDVIETSSLPIRITRDADGHEDRVDLSDKILKAFKSHLVLMDILRDLKIQIVQKLIPNLQVDGYQETVLVEAPRQRPRHEPTTPRPPTNPIHPEFRPIPPNAAMIPEPSGWPNELYPPGFEDEHQINAPHRHGHPTIGRPPPSIGESDLYPMALGPRDPLHPSFAGGVPHLPQPSGMHPTFDDPLFTHQGRIRMGADGRGGAYDPQAPPGARWDPLGPGGHPRYPGPGGAGPGTPFF